MRHRFSILLAVFVLTTSTQACVFGGALSLDHARMSFDQDGRKVTTSYVAIDPFYAVADLKNAPIGTKVDARWIFVDVLGKDINSVFKEQNFITEAESYSGIVYFNLVTDSSWPAGSYKVELYLNGALAQTLAFSVQ